ncbi:MAG: glycosyltransferase family 4 protein [Rhodospirillaceae bacterium]|nr:glycosyltransferase family 4 protein [Rhodospirillaceae bacterium]
MTEAPPAVPAGIARKRLLFLATDYASFRWHKTEMTRAAVAAGFEVFVAARCDRDPVEPPLPGVQVINLDWRRSGSLVRAGRDALADVWRVRRLMAGVRPDVLHTVDLKPAIIGSLALVGRPAIAVHSINGFGFLFLSRSPLARVAQNLSLMTLRLSAAKNRGVIVVQNAEDARLARARITAADGRVAVIRGSGLDPAQYPIQPLPPAPPVRFLVMARLLRMKGIGEAVAAQADLVRRGVASELWVAGSPDPGNPSSITQAEIDAWAALPGVRFLGHVPDVRLVLAQCHAVVHPALGGEGLPRALLEAAASGRTMIATAIPGNTEIVVDRQTGLLVPPGDTAALATAMQSVVQQPDEARRWATAARQIFVRDFAAEVVFEHHLRLYRGLVRGSAGLDS